MGADETRSAHAPGGLDRCGWFQAPHVPVCACAAGLSVVSRMRQGGELAQAFRDKHSAHYGQLVGRPICPIRLLDVLLGCSLRIRKSLRHKGFLHLVVSDRTVLFGLALIGRIGQPIVLPCVVCAARQRAAALARLVLALQWFPRSVYLLLHPRCVR